MGWRVLADAQAGAAVMTQIGEVMSLRVGVVKPPGDGWKYGAESVAIATFRANHHLTIGIANQLFQVWQVVIGLIKLLYGRLLDGWQAALYSGAGAGIDTVG